MELLKLQKGDTLTWSKAVAIYPASEGWQLSYYLRGASVINLTFGDDVTANGDDFAINITAVKSATFAVGEYFWNSFVIKGTERHTIESGTMIVLADLASEGAGYDGRSLVKKTLDSVRELIAGRKDVEEYAIGGRSIKRMNMADLLKWERTYAAHYENELTAKKLENGGKPKSRKILTRFMDV